MISIARDSGHRENCALFSLPAAVMFGRLDTSLYGGYEPAACDLVENAAVYDILPALDVFRDWKAYLVECQGQARLLYRGPQPHVQEFILQSGEFDMVLRATCAQIDALYEREMLLGH